MVINSDLIISGYLLNLHSHSGSGAVVENNEEVSPHSGEYSVLQLIQQSNEETNKPGQQINLWRNKIIFN